MLTVGFAAEAEALRKRAELSDAMLLRKEPLTAEELEPLCIEKCATARTAPSARRSCANQGRRPSAAGSIDDAIYRGTASPFVRRYCADALGCAL